MKKRKKNFSQKDFVKRESKVNNISLSHDESIQASDFHIPVLLQEVLEYYEPKSGDRIVDGTLGLGGHSEALLDKAKAKGCNVELLGIDRDMEALQFAKDRLAAFAPSVLYKHSPFSALKECLESLFWDKVNFILVDIGVSSLQLDSSERGFSFLRDGPLDMRMDQGSGQSAEELLHQSSEPELTRIIDLYGEEPLAARIAHCIVDARKKSRIKRTGELARIVEDAYPAKWRAKARNHPATRTFQALRIAVNKELEELESLLQAGVESLAPQGRFAVITFHSLEDRIVKHFFRDAAASCICPPHILQCICGKQAQINILTRKPLTASSEELAHNTRAKSAKLRIAEKV